MTLQVDFLFAFGSLAVLVIVALGIKIGFRRGRGPGDP